ncbi:MAG: 30S ribosomal protein S1, partial [Saprospiraceae bacterium]|nr:30S ribosomal protein S1 [Saprospiraceae bacterium]
AGNETISTYSDKEFKELEDLYSSSFNQIDDYEVVTGKVTAINEGDVVLDLNFKSDGLLPLSEFRDLPDLEVGDEVDVYVEQRENEKGHLVLSRRKAKLLKAWNDIVDSYNNGTIIKGTIISKTKGGLIVDCQGLETFLPGSQIDIKPIIDYDSYVGKTMEFKVVKINETIKNAVVSHKALIESDLAEQREAIISSLEKGQVLEGIVKNITDFGAFMDLGGVDGLLYITDISWGRINHPEEVLELNQKLNVVVLDFDENKKRISLGLKQLQPHPWDTLDESIKEGAVVKGKIVNIEDYGAFLEIEPGVEGLIHVSEVSWSNQPVNAREFFSLNQEYEAKIVTIDREERKMSLSLKQLLKDPWSDIEANFPVGSKHTGEVKNLTPYGVFVELEEGIGGMVHVSDLSWTKRFSHPSEFTKVGEDLEVVILEIDKENRKLSLGHKQLEENPWDTFENVFPVGSYHEATVIRKEDRGAIVQLPYGLEAFCPTKHLKKEDGSQAQVDESLTFKVIEFNRDDKRILVSHSRYLEDINREASDSVREEKRKERKDTRKTIKKKASKVERTTLGDMDVFSQLKEQLETTEEADKKEKAKSKSTKEKPEAPVDEKTKDEVKEKAEAKKAKSKKTTSKKKSDKGDDLKKIEGIGPKIAEILTSAGISDYATLADSDADKLREVLLEAGSRYKMFDPTTWPQQAKLAAEDKWEELEKLQDELKGGKAS